tara:strand:- start:3125 stop:4510 length:1386 start_codon:yes stop_codon:yes gene_type:complete
MEFNTFDQSIYSLDKEVNLVEFVPKSLTDKIINIGFNGHKYPLGRKLNKVGSKISHVLIKRSNIEENPEFIILKSLSNGDLSLNNLTNETKISYDNLRWHLLRKNNSLTKQGLIKVKGRGHYHYKKSKGSSIRIIFTITSEGNNKLHSIHKKIKPIKRNELTLVDSDGKEIILSSWWSSWINPKPEDLVFCNKEKRFLWKVAKNNILIQYHKSKNILYSTILPNEIKVNEEIFVTSLGLLMGEMRRRKGVISFSNSEPFLINYIFKFFEYFGMKRQNFSFDVQINTKNSRFNKNRLCAYWSKKSKITKTDVSNIFEYPEYGTKRSNNGRLDCKFYNIILKEIINNLIRYFVNRAKQNKNYAMYILRGLIAAEGYVSASTKSGSLSVVGISSDLLSNKFHIQGMLNKLGIKSSINKNCVAITHIDNYNKVIKYDLLKISKDKSKFKRLYNNFRYNKTKLISL